MINRGQSKTIQEIGHGKSREVEIQACMEFNPVIQDEVARLQKANPKATHKDIVAIIEKDKSILKQARDWERIRRQPAEMPAAPAAPASDEEQATLEAYDYMRDLYRAAKAMRGNISACEILALSPELQQAIGNLTPPPIVTFEAWLPTMTPTQPGGVT